MLMDKELIKSKMPTVAVIVLSVLVVSTATFLGFSLYTLLYGKQNVKESSNTYSIYEINASSNEENGYTKKEESIVSSAKNAKTGNKSERMTDSESEDLNLGSTQDKLNSVTVTKVFNFSCKFQTPVSKKETFYDSKNGNTLPYRLFIPQNYDSSKKYPVILFLHGAGEIGTDNEKHITYISKIFEYSGDLAENSFVVCPQSNEWWSLDKQYPGDQGGTLGSALHLLDYIKNSYSCDSNRIYVTGISMGGFATWDILENYGSIFAAGIPVCGGGDTSKAKSLINIPLRIYHGTDDQTVSFYSSESMYTAIISAGGEKAEMISLEGVGHNAWDYAYVDRDTLCWLFAQDKVKNPTCRYEYKPYLRIIDSEGKIIVSDEDVDSIYYGESYEERRIVTVDLVLKSTGKNKLNNAYTSGSSKEFTVCWLNEKLYTYKANKVIENNSFSIVDIFDSESVKCFNKTINKVCFLRKYR